MKKLFLTLMMLVTIAPVWGQRCHWVFLTDKQGTTFDPYSYFDAKAIARYQQNGADLYDISNYPLNAGYVAQVDALATEEVGTSRWLNAVAVMATDEQVEAIRQLPFVSDVVAIEGNMQMAQVPASQPFVLDQPTGRRLHNQLLRMGGEHFRAKGIDGKGVRIAVFDGGFPQVNTHRAFLHLRENHQIIKTWNFPNKREDVYGWNSHGLMTLSCIAGRQDSMDLGLATGAEFLLARTEVESEPFKEEVWWQMAVEWADKNGAQIISSSLGYGKDRYYTKDMNGQSYVAKAGNMAARKGILVCNSAGNEGDDATWRYIITPSDADSVLCVGGIMPSMTEYRRTSFSSYGPTHDGRQKPNVTAFAYAWTAATGASNNKFHEVPGTSFSCPLVSGFAACALQCKPNLKGMELFHEIEKSADLYPYCDYTYGYGVPQADYFTGDRQEVRPSFFFLRDDEKGTVKVVPYGEFGGKCHVFIKNNTPEGRMIDYRKYDLSNFNSNMSIEIISGEVVTVHFNGYTDTCSFIDRRKYMGDAGRTFETLSAIVNCDDCEEEPDYSLYTNPQSGAKSFLRERKSSWDFYGSLGVTVAMGDELRNTFWSPANRAGIRWIRQFTKAYGWGVGIEYGSNEYHFGSASSYPTNALEQLVDMNDIFAQADKIYTRRVNTNQFSVELFQRVRLVPGGLLFHKGLHWDVGAFVAYSNNNYQLKYSLQDDAIATKRQLRLYNVAPLQNQRLLYGITTRLTYDFYGIYVRYNLQHIGKATAPDAVTLPRLEVGLQLVID